MDQVPTVRDPCYLELARRDQPIEKRPQRGGSELVPEDPHVALIARVEPAWAGPTLGTLVRERLLFLGEIVDASVQNPRQLFPLVCRNIAEGRHERHHGRAVVGRDAGRMIWRSTSNR